MADQRLIGFEPYQFDSRLDFAAIDGKPLMYYVGDLAGDCAPFDRNRDTDACKRAIAMRRAAWNAYTNTRCHLVQKKIATRYYEYIAVPGRNVVPPLSNEEMRVRYLARVDRGGKLLPRTVNLTTGERYHWKNATGERHHASNVHT